MSRQPFTPDQYHELVSKLTPPSRMLRGYWRAFWVGGLICAIGQALTLWADTLHLGEITSPMFTTSVLVFFGTTLTGLGVYDRIGQYAGAGSAIPVTGFANSVVSPAMEFKSEGFITGTAAKMFVIAGPVIVFGIGASVIYGVILCLMG
jgi:stage V sporulation protein AC